MNFENQQKPCLIQTGQGFSVKYKEKFLYSKYDPKKNILQKIDGMNFLPGTVVLCMSPLLCYGIKELISKLPENCHVLLCERDIELKKMTEEAVSENKFSSQCSLLSEDELFNLPVILQKSEYEFSDGTKLCEAGTYKRVVRIDFSAGVQFYADFYNELEVSCVNSVKQFWANRFTLVKFGRRYSKNVFENLRTLPYTKKLEDYIGKIKKPIVVLGAGETSETGAEIIKNCREKYFVLCADTAFSFLLGHKIIPDGIVIDEAQSIIAQSFLGIGKIVKKQNEFQKVQVFQSLCSLPHVCGKNFPLEQITFYGTEYASNQFFENLKSQSFFPPVIPPFGSVGITAFFLAHLFKENENIPVTSYGLDFAYSKGKTHANGTPAHKRMLRQMSRVKNAENFGACFGENVISLPKENCLCSGNQKLIYSTPILQSYANTFNSLSKNINVFVSDWLKDYGAMKKKTEIDVSRFFETERQNLLELKGVLSGEIVLSEDERNRRIFEICRNRDYLFLHFPDGYKFNLSLGFLKRVRATTEFFLKIFK